MTPMPLPVFCRRVAFALALAALPAGAALAHHGWAWTLDETMWLTGTVEEVSVANPHAMMKVRTPEGLWQVDLAPPSATIRAGFTEDTVKAGDTVTVHGHRSRDPDDLHMKGIRVEVGGAVYDVYPERAGELDD
jgi:hypothetical protein